MFANNLQLNLDDEGSFGDTPNGNAQIEFNQRYRVRGIAAQVARNYFKWENPTDTYNIERVEDSRGPNSVLFGIGAAGGIINVSTKQAQLRGRIAEISLALGSHGAWRTAIDVNQPLGSRAAVRLNAVWNEAHTGQHHEFSETKRVHLAAKYQVTPAVQARVEFETGELDQNSGRTSHVWNQLLPWLRVDRPTFAATAPAAQFSGVGARLGANQLRYVSNSGSLINLAG